MLIKEVHQFINLLLNHSNESVDQILESFFKLLQQVSRVSRTDDAAMQQIISLQ